MAAEGRWIRTEVPFDLDDRRRRLTGWIETGRVVAFVAEVGDEVIGNVNLHVGETTGIGMGVIAEYRGCGTGGALLDAAVAWATAHRIPALHLEVYAHNAAAIALYRSHGFIEAGERYMEERRDGSAWETLRMMRALRTTA